MSAAPDALLTSATLEFKPTDSILATVKSVDWSQRPSLACHKNASDTFFMATGIRTERIPRTWLEKLLLWRRAYRTRIFEAHREALGRGPDPEASRKAALRRWAKDRDAENKA